MATKSANAQAVEGQVKKGVRHLIQIAGRNPDSADLKETPSRVLKAFREMTEGERQDPAVILSKVFSEHSDELVILKDIPFVSLCEHHLLPFIGTAHVGYLPEDKVVGLSKLARLVDCFAKRLQVQERMTRQIAEALMTILRARGAGVVVEGKHSCMACRGVKKAESTMVTSCLLGELRINASLRAEFLHLIKP